MPAIAPDNAMTARIFRRVRIPAYRAARGESAITPTSKPNRMREYSTHTTSAAASPMRNPSGTTTDEPKVGQLDASGMGLPCGNDRACSVDVSRQYDELSKMRYVRRSPAT